MWGSHTHSGSLSLEVGGPDSMSAPVPRLLQFRLVLNSIFCCLEVHGTGRLFSSHRMYCKCETLHGAVQGTSLHLCSSRVESSQGSASGLCAGPTTPWVRLSTKWKYRAGWQWRSQPLLPTSLQHQPVANQQSPRDGTLHSGTLSVPGSRVSEDPTELPTHSLRQEGGCLVSQPLIPWGMCNRP